MTQNDAERLRAEEAKVQPEHDTPSLGADLKQLQADIEALQLEGKIRLGLARGEIDPAPQSDESAA